jgi:ClpX C4-type zinc finger
MEAPPPALDCAYAIEYAAVDETVAFEQRQTLNVGGEWLGAVPQLAICQNLDESQFMVFHCDRDWSVLGVAAGYKSVAEAKTKTEKSYHGISAKWRPTGHTREEAARHIADQFKGQECSFCGRTPNQYESCVGDHVRICNHCVNEFHAAIHSGRDET